MDWEPERTDRLDKIVEFSEAMRWRRSSAHVGRTQTETAIQPEDAEPPPDAA